mgnify:FL=1
MLRTRQALETLGGPGLFQTTLPAKDREAIESQYKQAQTNIMNTGTRGGQLRSQLATLDRNRAGAVSGATIDASQRGIERALGLVPAGIPNAATQMGSRAQLGNTEQNRLTQQANMQAQADAQKGQGMGQLAGSALKAMMFL